MARRWTLKRRCCLARVHYHRFPMSAGRPLIVASFAILSASFAQAQFVLPLTFDAPGEFSANFRSTANSSTASQVTDAGNGFVQVLGGTGTTPWIGIFDTTPGDNSDPAQTFSGDFTVRLDISGANTNSSFGVFFFDPANPGGNNLLAIFNLDSPAGTPGNEQFRFWRDTSITTSAVSNIYGTSSFTGTNGAYDATTTSWVTTAANRGDEAIDFTSPFTFYTLDFTYSPSNSTLQVATGSFSATLGVALRINDAIVDASNTAKFDNFAVIPEPATASLAGLGALGFALLRRRR
jgi:hypothetical protein